MTVPSSETETTATANPPEGSGQYGLLDTTSQGIQQPYYEETQIPAGLANS